jgi:hypothetical protein
MKTKFTDKPEKTWISPSGAKSWSVFKCMPNGMVMRVGTYRSMKKAANVERELLWLPPVK